MSVCDQGVGREGAYPSMHVVVLRFFVQVTIRPAAVDHAAAHRDGGGHDMVDELRLAGVAHGIDAPLRKGQVNGPREVERRGRGIPKIWTSLLPRRGTV
jgi:hypothetical protein